MSTTTYELTTAPDRSAVVRCLLCRGKSCDPDSLQRLRCAYCSWFHEPLEERQPDSLRPIQIAAGEVQAALEIAENLPDEATRIGQLRSALRELRWALSRA